QEQEQEQEHEQDSGVPSELVPQSGTGLRRSPSFDSPEIVLRVFAHWRSTHNHPRSQLDDKRRKVIVHALKRYSESDVCQAISGYLNSPHHMGENDRNTKFDDIELLLRDAKHIDAGLKLYAEPPRTDLSVQTRRIVRQTEDWVPPEERHAAK
ncbi:MAG TPA: hypothetical protein VNU21_18280, partial [Usitatibacter sp.]|nr:hypothetical protein [Usitatibacter sp.]